MDAQLVVRATGDNPAVDIDGPGRVLAALRSTQADYVIEDGLPYGGAVEAVTVDALIRASDWPPTCRPRARDALIRRDRTTFSCRADSRPGQAAASGPAGHGRHRTTIWRSCRTSPLAWTTGPANLNFSDIVAVAAVARGGSAMRVIETLLV